MNFRFFASSSLVISSSLILGACGTSAVSFCDQVCACTGCSDSEKADCVDSFEDSEKVAGEAGCDGEFDALVECSADELECNDSTVTVDGCDAEAEAVVDCADSTIVIGGNSCEAIVQRLLQKFESCGLESGPGQTTACTAEVEAQARCFEPCFENVSCEVLTGQEPDPTFSECVSSCG